MSEQQPYAVGIFTAEEIAAARHTADELGFVIALLSRDGIGQSIEVAPFGTDPGTPLQAWDVDGAPSNDKGVWSLFKNAETEKVIATEHSGGTGRELTEDNPSEALRSISILHEAEDGTYLG